VHILERVLLGAVIAWFVAWGMKRTRTIVAD
jgi:hypothetical protein